MYHCALQVFVLRNIKEIIVARPQLSVNKSWFLIDEWEHCGNVLNVIYTGQVYEDYAEQADNWLSSKEAFLANDDVGVSWILLCAWKASTNMYCISVFWIFHFRFCFSGRIRCLMFKMDLVVSINMQNFLPRDALCIVQSAVLPSHVVCLSVCDVGDLWLHRLEILETNCTDN